jgi:hypothetical protein
MAAFAGRLPVFVARPPAGTRGYELLRRCARGMNCIIGSELAKGSMMPRAPRSLFLRTSLERTQLSDVNHAREVTSPS